MSSTSAASITSGVHGTFTVAAILVAIAIVIGITTLHQHKQSKLEEKIDIKNC